MKVVIVVDMQKDFITGPLGSMDAQRTVAPVTAFIQIAHGTNRPVIFTKDTHGADYLKTQEGIKLPVEHCIKGTPGWELVDEVAKLVDPMNDFVIEKPTFGSLELVNKLIYLDEIEHIDQVDIMGVCTDICVVSNALLVKAALPEAVVCVESHSCAGTSPEAHKAALDTMRSCQINVIGG